MSVHFAGMHNVINVLSADFLNNKFQPNLIVFMTFQVYNKRTGDKVGTVYRIGDTLAKQVMAVMLRGINTNLSMCVGYFDTKSAGTPLIYQLFWECVFHLYI